MNTPEFVLKHPCGLTISRQLAESDVAALPGTTRRDMRTGYVWYSLPFATIHNSEVAVDLCFYKTALDSLHLGLIDPALYGASWSDWSEEKEQLRARHTADWLRALGYPLGTFAWGQIWAGYDSKGASGGGGVRYFVDPSIRNQRLWLVGIGFIGCIAAVALAIAAYAIETRDTPNVLGLTHADLAYGGFPDVEALRTQTKAIADSYLAQNETKLRDLCGGPYRLAFDESLSPKTRALGYWSSFYYYCWDIYLPYSLQPATGSSHTILVQLSDATEEKQHDPAKFRVLRTIVLDREGRTKPTFE